MQFAAEEGYEGDVVYAPFLIREESSRTHTLSPTAPSGDVACHFIFWASFCTHGILLKRSAVLDVGGWKEDQEVCQEHELLLRMIKSGKRFGFWNQAEAVYRHHQPNTVSRKDPLQTVKMRMHLTDQCEQFIQQSSGLRSYHKRALYVARLEAARSAWAKDRLYAKQLAGKAMAHGKAWTSKSPGLPFSFQLAVWVLGFELAEHLAEFRRR
jgi:hypothetical protein